MKSLKKYARLLAEGRAFRLQGKTELAHNRETVAEFTMKKELGCELTDTLLTVWECSFEQNPMFLPEWQQAKKDLGKAKA